MKPVARSPWWKVSCCAVLLLTQLMPSASLEARGGGGGHGGGGHGGGGHGGGGRGGGMHGGRSGGMRGGASRSGAASRAGRSGQGRYAGRGYNRGYNRGYHGYYGRGGYGRYGRYGGWGYGGWGWGGWGWGGWGWGGYWWPWAMGGGLLLGSALTYGALEGEQNLDWNDIYQQGYQHGYLSGTQSGSGGAWCDAKGCYGSGGPPTMRSSGSPSGRGNRPASQEIPGVTMPLWEPPPYFMP